MVCAGIVTEGDNRGRGVGLAVRGTARAEVSTWGRDAAGGGFYITRSAFVCVIMV